MGSGTTRKHNDSVIINRPKTSKGLGGGTGGSRTGQSKGEDMNKVCPTTFRATLNSQRVLPQGAKLQLQDSDILLSGEIVGTLKKSQATTVARCTIEGFQYSGEVATEGNKQYGLFKRI